LELLAQLAVNVVLAPPLEGAIESVHVGGGHGPALQLCEVGGLVAASHSPSATGAPSLRRQETVCVCVPAPQAPLHAPKPPVTQLYVQPVYPVQAWLVGGCGTAWQSLSGTATPSLTRWHVKVRVCVPVPHEALHAPHAPTHW
jgi:hypothetical protein